MKVESRLSPVRRRDRVHDLLAGYPVDRTPIGEIVVSDRLVRELVGLHQDQPVPWAARRAVIERLGHDVVTVSFIDQSSDDALFWIRQWRSETDLFVVALASGLLIRAMRVWGTTATREHMAQASSQISSLFAECVLDLQHLARQIADAGADALMISDPLAGRSGLRWPPERLRQVYFPFLTLLAHVVHQQGLLFFLRAPGALSPVFEDVVAAEVDGLQGFCEGDRGSLSDLRSVVGRHFCLWGGVDATLLSLPDVEVWLVEHLRAWHSGPAGIPAILGTRNGLTEEMDLREVERLDAIWAAVEGTSRRLGVPLRAERGYI
ncbi:MAG: hypothetical protein GXP39_18530 [Chloroflexi bacterium]|nr:hypothetical protein [Chloroflexota bacterium]